MDKLKVLIAEDDAAFQALYKKVLRKDLYEIKVVENGEQAVSFFTTWDPDVVLLDIMMPVKSGYVALKEIRQIDKSEGRQTAVIMVTSLSDKSDIMDCIKVGIQGYIVKPFKYTELSDKIVEAYKKIIHE